MESLKKPWMKDFGSNPMQNSSGKSYKSTAKAKAVLFIRILLLLMFLLNKSIEYRCTILYGQQFFTTTLEKKLLWLFWNYKNLEKKGFLVVERHSHCEYKIFTCSRLKMSQCKFYNFPLHREQGVQ